MFSNRRDPVEHFHESLHLSWCWDARSLWNGMSKCRTDGCHRMNIMKVLYLSWYLRTKKMYCPLLWMGRFFPAALSIFYALAHTLLHPPLATIHMICGSELFNGTGHSGSSPFLNKDYMIFGRSIDFWCTVHKTKKRTWKWNRFMRMSSFTKYVHYGITDHVHFKIFRWILEATKMTCAKP